MRAPRPTLAILVALSFTAAAGCGSSSEGDTPTSTISADGGGGSGAAVEPTTTESTATTAPKPSGPVTKNVPVANGTDLGTKPKISRPKGTPPTELISKDLVVGKGKAAKAGDTVKVQYVGVGFKTGKQFDASWDRGKEPFAFPLGGGKVIPGWDQGVEGMKKGGRRELIIPPDLAYGPQGQPPDIQPDETLVFVIDMQSIG